MMHVVGFVSLAVCSGDGLGVQRITGETQTVFQRYDTTAVVTE